MPKVSKKSPVSGSAKKVVKPEEGMSKIWKQVFLQVCDNDVFWWLDGGDKGRFYTQCTPTNVLWVKKAMKYGWLTCRDRRLSVDDESNTNIMFYLNTKRFFFARWCCDKKFLKEKKDELKDFRALLFLTPDEMDDEESSGDEDESSTDEDDYSSTDED